MLIFSNSYLVSSRTYIDIETGLLNMWCWKDHPESPQRGIEEVNDACNGVNELDIKEWNITLRENNVCMDEFNVTVKSQKMEAIEHIEVDRRLSREKEIDDREKILLLQQKLLESERLELDQARIRIGKLKSWEYELNLRGQALDDCETKLKERNNVLNIVVRLNEKEKKIALQLRNREAVQPEQTEADLVSERERDMEEKEQELFLRERGLEKLESKMERKKEALENAIWIKEFRQVKRSEYENR